MSSVAIVSTSINAAPPAYAEWAKQGDLIVAGDLNAPAELEKYVRDIGGQYITPREQELWSFSDSIGWNCIQRRNAAVMTAYTRGYDYVATVDDDNMPTCGDWVAQHVGHLEGDVPPMTRVISGDTGWVDIGQFNVPTIRQRGTPYGVVRYHDVHRYQSSLPLVVSTAQVLGNPDCDAVTRIAYDPYVKDVTHDIVVDLNDYAAFNSQATVWKGQWAPLIACLPHVGRYDDIFASFIAKRIMQVNGVSFYAGRPCVMQERNPHDAVQDLRKEIYGMDHTASVITRLNEINFEHGVTLIDAYTACIAAFTRGYILPSATITFMREWRRMWLRYEW